MQSLMINNCWTYRKNKIWQLSILLINFRRKKKKLLHCAAYRIIMLSFCTSMKMRNCMRFSSKKLKMRLIILLMTSNKSLEIIFIRRTYKLSLTIYSIRSSMIKITNYSACQLINHWKKKVERIILTRVNCVHQFSYIFLLHFEILHSTAYFRRSNSKRNLFRILIDLEQKTFMKLLSLLLTDEILCSKIEKTCMQTNLLLVDCEQYIDMKKNVRTHHELDEEN